MELSIIKLIKELRQSLRRKPKKMVDKKIVKKKEKIVKKKREQIKTIVNGRELTLSQIALFYNLEPHTVYARYRVGNRGKLLIRPTPKQKAT